jgi:rRNA-processing protein FCF1
MTKRVLLDTNFILECVKRKIDFIEDLILEGFTILIPQQVIQELENFKSEKNSTKRKDYSRIALQKIKSGNYEPLLLEGSYVDSGIALYSQEHTEDLIATIDKELISRISSPRLVLTSKKKFEVFYNKSR